MGDPDAPPADQNRDHIYWHSAAIFISDNVATQIDGLAHITAGPDFHWYNGFKESEWGGDWGPRKCDASTIPPIVARGVLIDVAAYKQVDALPGHTSDLAEGPPGHSGLGRRQPAAGRRRAGSHGNRPLLGRGRRRPRQDRRARLRRPRPAATQWLVEDQGAIMVGSDTSGYEVSPDPGFPGGGHSRASLPSGRSGRPSRRIPLPGRAEPDPRPTSSATWPL